MIHLVILLTHQLCFSSIRPYSHDGITTVCQYVDVVVTVYFAFSLISRSLILYLCFVT